MEYRITADIDNRFYFPINYLKALIRIKNIKRIYYRKSTNKGYHLIIFTSKKYNKKDIFKIRKFIGDDYRRINVDKKRKNPKQYLFYKKSIVSKK